MNRPPASFLAITTLCGLLSACSAFTPPIEKPIIEDKSRASADEAKVAVFSTTSARRTVLVNFPKNGVTGKVCAEAPPDTADALVSSITFAAQTNVKSAEAEAAARAELNRELSNTVHALLDRSQGLQFFRDGAFHLCLAWQNNVIKDDEYAAQYRELLATAAKLIGQEIALKPARSEARRRSDARKSSRAPAAVPSKPATPKPAAAG